MGHDNQWKKMKVLAVGAQPSEQPPVTLMSISYLISKVGQDGKVDKEVLTIRLQKSRDRLPNMERESV